MEHSKEYTVVVFIDSKELPIDTLDLPADPLEVFRDFDKMRQPLGDATLWREGDRVMAKIVTEDYVVGLTPAVGMTFQLEEDGKTLKKGTKRKVDQLSLCALGNQDIRIKPIME